MTGHGRTPLSKHTFTNLMRRVAGAGFKGDFVRQAILPEWWDEACPKDPDLLPDIEVRLARFLGTSIAALRDPDVELQPPAVSGAQLRRARNLDRERLAPAIHSALRIGGAVVRSLKTPIPSPETPPPDGLAWREQLRVGNEPVTLEDVLSDLWCRGIPVVPLDVVPTPSFQGVACIVEDRPVIMLGHKHDEPGRVAFLVVHEAGHIAAGDCAPDQPVVDEDDLILDDAAMEKRAERFAVRVLVGADSAPPVAGLDFKELATRAVEAEEETGADASMIIFAWAAQTGDYGMASMAVKALYRGTGARRLLRRHFDHHVDLESASESDRALLRCVYGDPERHEGAD